jgi:pimeloyl-ACP methyl ester carboxylesterase
LLRRVRDIRERDLRFLVLVLALLLAGCETGSPPRGVACDGSAPVDRAERVPAADGAGLYVLMRGARCDAPVLLWLHGGPGGAERPLFRLHDGALEQHFVVAYWDQRGAGRSFDADADPRRLTIATHLDDLDHVVDRLRAAFRTPRLVLVGHSWGGALGLLYAARHPEKVAALLAAAPLVSTEASEAARYAFVAEEAGRRGDADALAALARLGPPPYGASAAREMDGLVDRLGGTFRTPPDRVGAVLEALVRGYVGPLEIVRIIRANRLTLDAMHDELQGLDLRRSVPEIQVPVAFLLGRHDHQTDPTAAAEYLARLGAPEKRLVWFERSAHNLPFEEPDAFVATVLGIVGTGGGLTR